ncbi:MAG TPA: PilN domain-containing protein [Candidatus Saccharimonadales bacterium]|nr:PilN domain-containing protein [Candidatus Saccharimonadales bacterium]
MIRINLLGTAKPKKGKKGRRLFVMPQLTTDGPSPLIAGLAILVVTSAGLYMYHMKLQSTHEQLQSAIKEADANIASMTKVKQAYLQRQKDYDAFKRRFDVIDQLRAGQVGPVPLLTNVSSTVNKTDGVWLLNMKDDGANVSLDGVALGPNSVANLMTNLRRSGYFKNVELHETAQEDNPKIQTFSFSLVCEKSKA